MRDVEQKALEALEAAPWFAGGLRFTCTGCGHCCTGASGAVYLSELDVQRLASKLRLSREEFITQYTRWSDSDLALIDKSGSSECIFLSGKACSVYDARPTQCRAYPFWLINVLEPDDWAAEAQACEGIDHPEAALIPVDKILQQCRSDLENEILPA